MNVVKTLRIILLLGIKKTLLPQTGFAQRAVMKVDHLNPLLAKYHVKRNRDS